ncbi:mitochondrial FAD carrier protein [Paraphysoderma sedebokerense]|nr:mitochondrial FAD carrier protein [Paraphysoderma sedebokerense]
MSDSEDSTTIPPPPNQQSSFFGALAIDQAVAGFTAGAVSTVILHPLDLVKTRYQVDTTTKYPKLTFTRTLKNLKQIFVRHGVRGLYQGLEPNFVGATVSWGMYFWWYSIIKSRRLKANQEVDPSASNLAPSEHLIAAAQAGALTSVFTNPIWLVKTRMCIQSAEAPKYRSLAGALKQIYREEGIRGLYRGFVPQLFGVSHGAIQFMVYEEMKKNSAEWKSQNGGTSWLLLGPTAEYIIMAASSKLVATCSTYPYQVIKSRLQDHRGLTRYDGVLDTIQKIYRNESIFGFYKGLGANVIRVMPGTCITFAVYGSLTLIVSIW